MNRRNGFSTLSLSLILIAGLSGCLKTRSDLRSDNGNPDSGYETKVTDISANENQKVSEELRGEINRLNGRIDDLQKKNDSLAQDSTKRTERESQLREMELKIQELQASQAALIDALQKKEKDREEKRAVAEKEKEKEKEIPKGKTAEEALFLRAEGYYAKEQYKKAILDFSTFQEKYPKSKNISKSLLKIGMSFDALGMKSDGKAFYQEILDKHAKSPEAKIAKSKLK